MCVLFSFIWAGGTWGRGARLLPFLIHEEPESGDLRKGARSDDTEHVQDKERRA